MAKFYTQHAQVKKLSVLFNSNPQCCGHRWWAHNFLLNSCVDIHKFLFPLFQLSFPLFFFQPC